MTEPVSVLLRAKWIQSGRNSIFDEASSICGWYSAWTLSDRPDGSDGSDGSDLAVAWPGQSSHQRRPVDPSDVKMHRMPRMHGIQGPAFAAPSLTTDCYFQLDDIHVEDQYQSKNIKRSALHSLR